jgi:hypothetical protein
MSWVLWEDRIMRLLFGMVLLIAFGSAISAYASDTTCINSSEELLASGTGASAPKKICHYDCPNKTKPTETLKANQSCAKTIVQGAAEQAPAKNATSKVPTSNEIPKNLVPTKDGGSPSQK